ncbi:MAG: insulinase family protein [Bacteroidota bacterium]|nr:insulinase family protein [Bacteroidota bacterium]
MKFYLNIFRLIIVLFFFSAQIFAQTNLNDKLPVDPKVKIGKLSNGLTYYIRQNKKPEKKVELRLVVNTGSIMEDEDQQGLAHLTEHMAFNGSTHFKKNDLVSFLQSIGVTFGNDLNAYTSFDETVYILPIPLDKPGNLDKGFQILEDWAHNLLETNEDIDEERPVVLEESRLGKGAEERMFRKIYPKLFEGSKYAERLPIGIDSIIKNSKYESLRRFYKEWYRPDLMAVMVVGDIEPAKAEEMIRNYFARLTNPVKEKPRTNAAVPPYAKSGGMVVTDKEATNYIIQLNYSAKKINPEVTLNDYKRNIVKNIFTTLLNQRLRELTQKENPPFVFAGAGFGSYARGYESFQAQIATGSNDATKGLEAFVQELERVKKFGFTEAELERAKKNLLNQMDQMYKEKDKTESALYVEEYIRNFLTQESMPGIDKEHEYYQQLIPKITLEEVNAVGDILKQNSNKFIALTGPEPNGNTVLPTGDELLAKVNAVENMNVTAYEEKIIGSSLLNAFPKAGKIIADKKDNYLGTRELTLSNGVTVTLKSTDFKNDQILFSAVRPGGKNSYGLKDKYSAEYATAVVSSMGIGNFPPTDLRKALAGKSAIATPTFTGTTEGMSGSSTVKDAETMFQLMYLYFTSPRRDTSLFKSYVQKNKSQMAMLGANPQFAFIDTLYKVLFNNNPLAPVALPKAENFDKINLDRALQIYKERFGDVNGMHFTFVGNFKEDEIKSFIEKYIASLPSSHKKYFFIDNKVRPVNGKVNVNVYKGKEQKSLIVALYHGEIPYSEDIELKAAAISEILNIRIIEELREKIQGIYTGNISPQVEKVPYPHYAFVLQLPAGPEKVDTLLHAINKEIENLKKFGPSQKNLDKVKTQWHEKNKVNMKENNYWLTQLQDIKFPGSDPKYFIDYEKYVNALTIKGVQDAAKLLLNGNNVVTAILRPEKK